MTKKGFGEMAITAALAGPVFNILIGSTFSNFASYAKNAGLKKNGASFFKSYLKFYYLKLHDKATQAATGEKYGEFDKSVVIPIVTMGANMFVLALALINGISMKFNLSFKVQVLSLIIYIAALCVLVWYALAF